MTHSFLFWQPPSVACFLRGQYTPPVKIHASFLQEAHHSKHKYNRFLMFIAKEWVVCRVVGLLV